ncbi:MAG: ABC transporter, partial [Cyclobacteriaceae bacterium]
MKDLSYLNKYLFKYKFHLIFGTLFIIVANLFGIVPAVIVRYAFDMLESSMDVYIGFSNFNLQTDTYGLFVTSIVILAVVILVSALLRGVFMFFM